VFSGRIEWSLEPNEYSKLLDAKRKAGVRIVDLTESNPTRAGLVYPPEIIETFAKPAALVYEPTPWGLAVARNAVAGVEGVPADQVLMTASTSESYSYLFKLLCDPGDRVLVPRPSYPLFEFLAKLESVRIDHYSLVYERGSRWCIDFDSIERVRSDRHKAILLVNPNNPTGSYVSNEEIARLAELGLPVVSDEVFHAYPLEAERPVADWRPVSDKTLLFRLNGLSKQAGLPQMKAGWIVMDGPEGVLRTARERLELIADTFLSVATPVQHALPELLAHGEQVRQQISARTKENLEWLRTVAKPLRTEAGWYALLPLEGSVEEYEVVLSLLEEDDVLVQPGFFYDFETEGWLVLSLLPPPGEFREGITRLLRRLN
jgi:aspartate/methionine/tyrosine aminotransferase